MKQSKHSKTFKSKSYAFQFPSVSNDMNKHVESVHERKKPSKCNTCDFTFSQKGHMKSHVASVHEEKKPYKTTNVLKRMS